jgi:hypothetical protein
MHKPLPGLALACLLACLGGCNQTTRNAVTSLVDAGANVACADLSKGDAALYGQCTNAAGSLIPIGQAIAAGALKR